MVGDFRETLYTVDSRGRRKWVYAALVKGSYYYPRLVFAWGLMAFYVLMPWVTIGGEQGILLNITARRFVFFGAEFWADDTLFLFLLFGILAFSLFFFTALLGRVWCGWACPETVYLEFLFRPIERLIEGSPARRKRLDEQPWNFEKICKKLLKHGLCAFAAWVLASSLLAYFIGREPLVKMMGDWPQHNPVHFALTLIFMGVMAFQFGWFREQFCTVLCPYARFQSVLMDGDSLVVGYDTGRGEPRGKLRAAEETGDCIDCEFCVRVCPTGIDIRNGVQLECIACTQCADACDSVMSKIGRLAGLIRYDSENRLLGRSLKRRMLRARVLFYGALLAAFVAAFVYDLSAREHTKVQILRGAGARPFQLLGDGRVSNTVLLKISNKTAAPALYTVTLAGAEPIEIIVPINPVPLAARELKTVPLIFNFDRNLLKTHSSAEIEVGESGGVKLKRIITLLGPYD